MKISNETKIGLMVSICFVALLVFSIRVGNFTFYKKGYQVYLKFHDVGGIKLHAPIRISGVDVGEVKNIKIEYGPDETWIVLTAWIQEGIKIREDARMYVTMLGLMGEKYIEITSGSKDAKFISPGAVMIGKDPIIMEVLFETIESGVKETEGLIRNLTGAAADNRKYFDETVLNIHNATENLEEFTAEIKANPWKLLYRGKERR